MDKKKLYWIGGSILAITLIVGGIIIYRRRNGITASKKSQRRITITRNEE